MKKILVILGIVLLLPLFFSACGEPEPESMTFIDDYDRSREFTIYENLEFKVKFVGIPGDPDIKEIFDTFPGLGKGVTVRGKAKGTKNKWTDAIITGKAQNMKSNNKTLSGILKEIGSMEIKLEYIMQNNSIAAVNVDFPGNEELAGASKGLMGGTYLRK